MTELPRCSGCGHAHDVGQNFCGTCGQPLVVTCSRCGTAVPASFKYCGGCGTPIARAADPGARGEERRVVTVIFADLVGFTSRAERLDPEDVRAILTPYYAALREQIELFGGTVEKFIGDAVVGIFGAPVAHGDDPERAVRAALQIRDHVSTLKTAAPAPALAVRIGVNTGEAIVALDARTLEGEGMVTGDVVNTAARLQTAAPTNGIIVGEDTYRCTYTTIDYEVLDPIVVKGKELPVAAWCVRGAPRPPGERSPSDMPIVGREPELEALANAWQRARVERRPQLVTIFGLAGVGKSRLTAEFLDRVRAAGGRVLIGRSLPYGESSPYDAFGQQIKRLTGADGRESLVEAAEMVTDTVRTLISDGADPVVAHLGLLLGLPTEGSVGEARDRSALFESASRVVQAVAVAGPTVLLFEDLHWADPSLLDLIDVLLTQIKDAPLLILAAARPELDDKRHGWTERADSLALALEPLDRGDALEFADLLLARAAERDLGRTADEIIEAGEGNPLFIEELVASVAERSARPGAELPTSIRGIIAARLDAIAAPERSVLLDASVVGRVFWDGALARLTPEPERLPELLESLESRDFIRAVPASRFVGQRQFVFKHALIRDVAYAALPRSRRRAAHGAVAAFLEELHADRESPAEVGHHWFEADDKDRAVGYIIAAADQASRGWAKAEAVSLYRQAVTLIDEGDVQRRKVVRLRLAVAQQMLYHLQLSDARRAGEPATESGA